MNRRTFLRVLGSAAIGAVVAPALPLPLPPTVASTLTEAPTSYGVLTLEMLRQAIDRIERMAEAPQVLYVHLAARQAYERLSARDLGLVFDAEV